MVLLFLVLLVAVWVAFAPDFFQLPGDPPTRLLAPTADGWTLAIWFRPAAHRRFQEPVVLCHGLANNSRFMEFLPGHALAHFLSAAGFDCYSVDLRGAGGSRGPVLAPLDGTFDDYVLYDVPAVLDAVRAHSGQARAFWVGHSMGGLVALAGADETRLQGLVTVGSPVFFAYPRVLQRLLRSALWLSPAGAFPMRWVAQGLAPVAGRFNVALPHLPANLRNLTDQAQRVIMAQVFADIWRGVLLQFVDWVGRDAFSSQDRAIDYRDRVARLQVPMLVVGGSVDNLAPLPETRKFYSLVTAPDRELLLLGKEFGEAEDYGHGDLLLGKHVEREVFPRVAAWLEKRATRLA